MNLKRVSIRNEFLFAVIFQSSSQSPMYTRIGFEVSFWIEIQSGFM